MKFTSKCVCVCARSEDQQTGVYPCLLVAGSARPNPWWPHIARYCDTIAAIPHIARYFLREVSTPPKWCETPPWDLVLHRHICAIPHFATYRAIIVRYPIKQAQKSFAILSLQVSRDMKSIAAGPLRPNPERARQRQKTLYS